MHPVVQAAIRSWSVPPEATLALALAGLTYLRGGWLLRRVGYPYLPAWRIGSFMMGLFALWFALASPLDTFSSFVLTAHMLQHMILMMIAPPLLLLGEPLIPFVRGMPRFAAREFAGPFLNWRVAKRAGLTLTNPVVALLLMGTVMFFWHVPGPYELAVRSSAWHETEHACFFFASIIFWWPVIQPWPSRAQWPRWGMVPYLMIADVQNTVLSAVLVFSDKILYQSYAAGPSLFGFTPAEDQAAAGAIMWVVGSVVFIVPAVLIAVQCLSRRKRERAAPVLRRKETRSVKTESDKAPAISSLIRFRGFRLSPGAMEAASFVALFALTAAGFALVSRLATDDDNQVLRAWQPSGPFAAAVYGPADDIPAGPATFAVLVQDRVTHELLLDGDVEVSVREIQDNGTTRRPVRALLGDENKLLYSAELDLDTEGPWLVNVEIRHPRGRAGLSIRVNVVKNGTESTYPRTYIVILVFAVVLCAVFAYRDSARNSPGLGAPIA
jgi:cytochrome c oxidase assembly factor CtaG